MTKATKACRAVGEDYLAKAQHPGAVHRFPFPPEMVWNALLDAEAWTQWLDGITGVTWTSPEPFGVGTTRTVELGAHSVDEVFFAWDPGERMAFYFERASLPITAAIEDYRVRQAPGGSELIWSGRASGPLIMGWLVTKALTKGIRGGLPKLEALIAQQPGRFGG